MRQRLVDMAQPFLFHRGAEAIWDRYSTAQAESKRLIRSFVHGHHLYPEERISPEQAPAIARGVEYRVIYESSLFTDQTLLADMSRAVEMGEHARVVTRLPFRLVLIDDTHALVPFIQPDTEPEMLEIRGMRSLEALEATFETFWESAVPLQPHTEADGPDPDDHQLLCLLMGGLTDESVAREMGVSSRTVLRRIARLQERLGARSRFQLGAQAMRRGWV